MLLQRRRQGARSPAPRAPATSSSTRRATYTVRRRGARLVDLLRRAAGKARRRSRRRCASTRPAAPLTLRGALGNGVRDGLYRGALEFTPGPSAASTRSTRVGLDDYVRGVVTGESPPRGRPRRCKAQAVAARTYAITTDAGGGALRPVRRHALAGLPRRRRRDADDRRGGRRHRAARSSPTTASRSTTYFFSTSGGETENVENSFARLAAQAVAEGGRRPLRQRLAQAPLGPVPLHRRPGPAQAAAATCRGASSASRSSSAASRRASCARRWSAPAA